MHVNEFIEKYKITTEAKFGDVSKMEDMFDWAVTISSGEKKYEVEYNMGTAHAKLLKAAFAVPENLLIVPDGHKFTSTLREKEGKWLERNRLFGLLARVRSVPQMLECLRQFNHHSYREYCAVVATPPKAYDVVYSISADISGILEADIDDWVADLIRAFGMEFFTDMQHLKEE